MLPIGIKVRKNPETWIASEFDGWGAGEGIGVVIDPGIAIDVGAGECNVRWPNGVSFQFVNELLIVEQ